MNISHNEKLIKAEKEKTIKSNNIMLPLSIYMGNMYGENISYSIYAKLTNGNSVSFSHEYTDEYSLCCTKDLKEAEMIREEISFSIS